MSQNYYDYFLHWARMKPSQGGDIAKFGFGAKNGVG